MTEEILEKEISPQEQEEQPEQRPCSFIGCPDNKRGGMMCNNLTDAVAFPLMDEDASMHLECYIHQCVYKTLIEAEEEKNKAGK